MAITPSAISFYNNGSAAVSSIVGRESNHNRIARYTFTAPTHGATSLTFTHSRVLSGDGSPDIVCALSESATGYENAGSGTSYDARVTINTGNATATCTINKALEPGKTYYLYFFPRTTGYGYVGWPESLSYASINTSGKYSYQVTVAPGANTSITVNGTNYTARTTLTKYHGDALTVSASASTGYHLTAQPSSSYTVTSALTLSSTAAVNAYTLTINGAVHVTTTVRRTSSPLQGAALGTLTNGSTIYHGDTLSVTFAATPGYEVKIHTLNGSAINSGATHTVSGNVTVVMTEAIMALLHIGNGDSFDSYLPYIGGVLYRVYVYNGSEWEMYA